MSKELLGAIKEMNDLTLMRLAKEVQEAMELRGLPDHSFKQGYKAGFLAALCDEDIGPGQVWSREEAQELYQELERRFAA